MHIKKAIIPAAGLGTRILPATKAIPKELLTVYDRPLIQWAVEEAYHAGIEEVILVTARGKDSLIDHFDRHGEMEKKLFESGKNELLTQIQNTLPAGMKLSIVRQPAALGLGHAVHCASHLIGDEPFAVLLPDDFVIGKTSCLKQLVDIHAQQGGTIIASVEVPEEKVNKYGILTPIKIKGKLINASGMVEKPSPNIAPSKYAVIGRYILDPNVMKQLKGARPGAGNEIQLTDAIDHTLPDTKLHGYLFEGKRFDCGARDGWIMANIEMALKNKELAEEIKKEFSHHFK